jgi:hypothetical protein
MTTITENSALEKLTELRNAQIESFIGDLSDLKGFLNDAVSDKIYKMINDRKGTEWSQKEFDLIIYNFNNLKNILDTQIKIIHVNNTI